MKGKLIAKLSSYLNEGGNSKKIETCEEVIVESIDEFAKEESFYSLPTDKILKILMIQDY